jgi:hypothetical protein
MILNREGIIDALRISDEIATGVAFLLIGTSRLLANHNPIALQKSGIFGWSSRLLENHNPIASEKARIWLEFKAI